MFEAVQDLIVLRVFLVAELITRKPEADEFVFAVLGDQVVHPLIIRLGRASQRSHVLNEHHFIPIAREWHVLALPAEEETKH